MSSFVNCVCKQRVDVSVGKVVQKKYGNTTLLQKCTAAERVGKGQNTVSRYFVFNLKKGSWKYTFCISEYEAILVPRAYSLEALIYESARS